MRFYRFVILSWIYCLYSSPELFAQFGTGLIVDDEAYEALPQLPDLGRKGNAVDTSRWDLTPFCPEIINQGSSGTCTAWSTAYATYTIQRAVMNNWYKQKKRITENAYSAYYVYNQIRQDEGCEKGSYIEDALTLLKKNGNTLSKLFDPGGCEAVPTEKDHIIARQHKITEFRTLFSKGEGDHRRIIHKVKQSLVDNKPVIVCMYVTELFTKSTGWWVPSADASIQIGAHAMVVIGFDDSKQGGSGAFKIMNSWGTKWGEEGFFWIPYNDFAQKCCGGYQMSIRPTDSSLVQYGGELSILLPQSNFDKANVTWNRNLGVYESKMLLWEVGTQFQLEMENVQGELYVYAFSLDSEGKISLHWPRDSKLDSKFQGEHNSAVIISPEIAHIIPEKYKALILEEVGVEYICFLFSQKPLDDINAKLNALRGKTENLPKKLRTIFGDQLVSQSDIYYQAQQLAFDAHAQQGKIIPLVVRLDVQN